MYRDLHGEEIGYLIADLMHLADVDEHPGGGLRAVLNAARYYGSEQPTWPVEQPTGPKYLGQFRPKGEEWITIAEGDDSVEPEDVAGLLWPQMQRADFRTGEILAHVQDLARGHVLVADNGTAFRVIENPARKG
ncbi:hypothetical protein [Streptomyces reticuli]|uniref:hypothetical protein n=1 Tax=Streptomyces reticuli TaxID=1926 RepID=UPI00073DDB3B|nr:hypothetical protein TUE45_pSRTUE45a_0063 [Streptomyces reticuli]